MSEVTVNTSVILSGTTEALLSTEQSDTSSLAGSTEDLLSTTQQSTIETSTHVFDTYGVTIHPHWYQFPIVPDEWHYIIGVFITIVGFTGIIGNSFVIWMFSSSKSLRTPSNMFIVNLAVSDLTFSVVNGFPLFSLSAFNKRWIFGPIACEFYGLIGGIFGLMSINTMVTIAIDRYYAIAKPLKIAKTITRKRSFYMIVGVWIWSLLWACPPIFGWGAYIPEGFGTSCTFDYLTRTSNNRSFIFCLYIMGFAVPLFIIFVCYFMVVQAVRKHEKEMKKTAKKLNAEIRTNQDKQKMEIRVAKVAISILVLYLLSWLPYATVALVAQFGDATLITPYWSEIPVIFAKASAMHNPIVYALSHPKFRAALYQRVPWLLCCFEPPPTSASAASGTYRDRSRRSVISAVGGASISSDMSNISDTVHQEQDVRMREFDNRGERERETTFNHRRSPRTPERSRHDMPTGQIIQDLVRALVDVTQREKPGSSTPAVRPVYIPSNILQAPEAGKDPRDPRRPEDVFVLDGNTLPGLASYLAQFSMLNAGGVAGAEGGIGNPSFDHQSEEKRSNLKPSEEKSDTAQQGTSKTPDTEYRMTNLSKEKPEDPKSQDHRL